MATTGPYNLNSGMRCVKYMLLTINVMFMITAILLMLIGTTIRSLFTDFSQFIGSHFFSLPALLIAVSCIMLLVSSFGCFGAIKESTMLINIYGVLLFLIFILEISAAIAAFCMQIEVKTMLVHYMRDSMLNYESERIISDEVDFMQAGLECCGIYDARDWDGIITSDQTSQFNGIQVPISCCADIHPSKDNSTVTCTTYDYGCLPKMQFLISQSIMLIATGATTVAFVQFLGVLCAFMLAKTIRRNKSIREARRWQLQQNLGILVVGSHKNNNQQNSINHNNNNNQESGYTQLENNSVDEKLVQRSDPITYTPNSPSVN